MANLWNIPTQSCAEVGGALNLLKVKEEVDDATYGANMEKNLLEFAKDKILKQMINFQQDNNPKHQWELQQIDQSTFIC